MSGYDDPDPDPDSDPDSGWETDWKATLEGYAFQGDARPRPGAVSFTDDSEVAFTDNLYRKNRQGLGRWGWRGTAAARADRERDRGEVKGSTEPCEPRDFCQTLTREPANMPCHVSLSAPRRRDGREGKLRRLYQIDNGDDAELVCNTLQTRYEGRRTHDADGNEIRRLNRYKQPSQNPYPRPVNMCKSNPELWACQTQTQTQTQTRD